MRIFDSFMFNTELDMLEVRLTELYDVVDFFVIGACTFSSVLTYYLLLLSAQGGVVIKLMWQGLTEEVDRRIVQEDKFGMQASRAGQFRTGPSRCTMPIMQRALSVLLTRYCMCHLTQKQKTRYAIHEGGNLLCAWGSFNHQRQLLFTQKCITHEMARLHAGCQSPLVAKGEERERNPYRSEDEAIRASR